MSENQLSSRARMFREAINQFITARQDDKLKESATPEQRAKYEYGTWLADAARRAAQIQSVTHTLKAIHPDARGTNLYCPPADLPSHEEIGSHTLGNVFFDDIVGNAAALDVYKFLKIEVEGKRLLDSFLANDPDLLMALDDDGESAKQWRQSFCDLVRGNDVFVAHTRSKQLYWCVGDDPSDDRNYHVVQPLFPSSLAHCVHQDIKAARFGETNKEARQAYRNKKAHATDYRDYRGLVEQKLGGTKPQNISQLNSERGGVNYLFASLPPSWRREQQRNYLYIDTALRRFHQFEGVAEQIQRLGRLLSKDPEAVKRTRDARKSIERFLAQSLVAFAMEAQYRFDPGWTRQSECRLPLCERLWLDPGRAELPVREGHEEEDRAFIKALTWGDWPDEVAGRYANWLNDILQKKYGLPVGDVEFRHWARQALVEAPWPVPRQRRAKSEEVFHG